MSFRQIQRCLIVSIATLAAYVSTSPVSALTQTTVAEFDQKPSEEQNYLVADAVIEMEDFYRNKKNNPDLAQCIRGLYIDRGAENERPEGMGMLLTELEIARAGDPTKHHVERIILGLIKRECSDHIPDSASTK